MEPPASLSALLRQYMQRMGYTADRLAKESTVPKPTIVNWLEGRAKKPREWIPLLLIAAVLHLDERDTTALLQAAGHAPLDTLRPAVQAWLPTITSVLQRRLIEPYVVAEADRVLDAAHQRLAALPLDAVPTPAMLPPGSRMPLQRNVLFVGRRLDLQALARALKRGDAALIGQGEAAVATGMGGIGKTQLAAEFVHRYGQFFVGGVFWLSFADPAAVPAEIAACGGAAHLALRPDWDNTSFDEQVRLVQAAWQSPLPRLLIFDNVEDEALVQHWRPTTGGCHILVTSRRAHWDAALGVQTLPVRVLQRDESIALLHHFVAHSLDDIAMLDTIANHLGDLPLAVHLAGRYLQRYQHVVTPASYLADLDDVPMLDHPSLQEGGISPTKHVQHLARAFALSYNRLNAQDTIDHWALALLARAACFAPGEPIGRDLLFAALAQERALGGTPLKLEDALQRLLALGLVEEATHSAVRMHRLVIAFVQQQQTDDQAQAAIEQTLIELMNQYNEASDVTTLLSMQTHLRFVTDQAAARDDARAANMCESLGYHLWHIGSHAESHTYLERALKIREHVPAPDQAAIASALNLLALSHSAQGQYSIALHTHERALAIWLDTVGPAHACTIAEWNNLAFIHMLHGHYDDAYTYFSQSLAASRRVFGLKHAQTARLINNLGWLFRRQGRYRRAHRYLELALKIRTQILPSPHVATSMTLTFVGEVLYLQSNYAMAWQYHQQALAMRVALFGEDHYDPAESYWHLGRILHAQGKLKEAREYLDRSLAIRTAHFGATHRSKALSMSSLGALLRDQGEHSLAQSYLEQAIGVLQQHAGNDYPELVEPLNDLGVLCLQQGNVATAHAHFERALAICYKQLDDAHPDTAMTLNNLGQVHQAQANSNRARECYEHALAICQQRLAPDHPLTRSVKANLAALGET